MTTVNKGLNQPAYNSYVNTWGTGPLNDNFGYIDLALGGSTLLNATGLGGTTVVLMAAQCVPLTLAISGVPAGIVTYSVPAGIGGQWVVRNGTTGGYAVRVQSASGGTYVTVNAGDNVQVSCDGTASGMVRNDTTATAAGSNAQVQYNSSGVLAGSANMTFNGTVLSAHTLKAVTGGVVFPDTTTQTTAAAVAGADTQVQFNDGGAFAGDAGLTFNKTTNVLSAGGLVLTGTQTMTGAAVNAAQGANIASATTTDIGAATGNYVNVTGTMTITGFGTVQAGTERTVTFTGALTLTHNGTSLILPGNANILTAAGDTAIFVSLGSGNWKCVAYTKASGRALTPAVAVGFRANVDGVGAPGALAKMTLSNATFNVGGYWDNGTQRFTPAAGVYSFQIGLTCAISNSYLEVYLYKNGAAIAFAYQGNSQTWQQNVSINIADQANGTDYYEAYWAGGAISVPPSINAWFSASGVG